MKLTAARRSGLDVLCRALDPVRVSNITSPPGASPNPTVYWQVADFLVGAGLATVEPVSKVITLTDEGRSAGGVPDIEAGAKVKRPKQVVEPSERDDGPQVLVQMPIDKVRPASDNVRVVVTNDVEFEGLVDSVKARGILEPLLVTPADDGVEILAGERRYLAAQAAGLSHLPVIVREDLNARDRLEHMMIENLQRVDLTPLQEAEGFSRLVALGAKQKDIHHRLGVSEGQISKRLSLLRLPEEAKDLVASKTLPVTAAEELARLSDHPNHLATALKQALSSGGDQGHLASQMHMAVTRQLDGIERQERVDAIAGQLEAAGVAVVDHPQHYDWSDLPQRPLQGQENPGYPAIDVGTVEEHSQLPCHGAAVSKSGEVVYVCLDPVRHLPPGTPIPRDTDDDEPAPRRLPGLTPEQLETQAAEQAERQRTEAALEAAVGARLDVIAKICKKLPAKPEILEYLLVRVVFGDSDVYLEDDALDTMVKFSGLDVGIDASESAKVEALEAAAMTGGDTLVRVGFARALVTTEEEMAGWSKWSGSEAIHRHFALLIAHGYEPDPAEYDKLGLQPGQTPGTGPA